MDKVPFRQYKLEDEKDPNDITFTVRITPKDKEWLEPSKKYIKQPKNSTALKQLAEIGSIIVLHDKKMASIINVVLNNFRRKERLGIGESEYKIK